MKITFLVSGSIRSNFSYRALTLARELVALGHEATIIAPRADKYNNFVAEDIREIGGVTILQPFQFNTKSAVLNLVPYIIGAGYLTLKQRADLVYIYKPTPVSVVGLLAKLFYNTPVVLDMDDLGSEVMRIEGHPALMRTLVAWSERLAARAAYRIVVASTYLKQMYAATYPHKPIYLMPNGVESGWLKEPVTPAAHARRVVFMGAINRTSILEPLFDAMPAALTAYPDIQLLVIGAGTYLDYFKEKAAALGIVKSVTFTGWLPLEQAREQLQAGDIGYSFMPDDATTRAASNMKVPQYMARGVVPLVSDVGDLAATIQGGRTGYITPTADAAGVTAALIEALGDATRHAKSVAARAYAGEALGWSTLAREFAQWILPSHANKEPKVYVVAISVPGNVGGGEVRNYNLLKQIRKNITPDVTVFSIASKDSSGKERGLGAEACAALQTVQPSRHSVLSMLRAIVLMQVPPYMLYFRKSGVGDIFRTACEESLPDIVQIEQLQAYYAIRKHIPWLKSRGVKIVFDCHNIEYRAFGESLDIFSLPKKLVGMALVPHMKSIEIEATRAANLVLACSKADASFFESYNPHTVIVANGVDISEFSVTTKREKPVLIFMGGVGYPPNEDGLEFYLRDIHPKVLSRVPEARLLAIGATPQWMAAKKVANASIEALGFVDDVQPYLAQAAVGICPVRVGSGTRIKILTYMAAGLPVVSTAKGAEGVGYTNGENIYLEDDPHLFADAIVKLLTHREDAERMAQAGRQFVAAHYDWQVLGENLKAAYATLNHEKN